MEIKSTYRNSNIDLLRLLSLGGVIAGHYIAHEYGLLDLLKSGIFAISPSHICILFLYSLCITAVNIFLLISGYFGVSLKKKKLLVIVASTYILNIAMSVAANFIFKEPISLKTVVFPFSRYWYIGVYCLVLLFSPIINQWLNALEEKNFKLFILLYALIWGVYALIAETGYIAMNNGYSFFHAVAMLIIGRYLRLYKKNNHAMKLMAGAIIIPIVETGMILFAVRNSMPSFASRIWGYNSIFCVGLSIALFQFFRHLGINNFADIAGKSIIGFCATGSLYAYLIDSSTLGYCLRRRSFGNAGLMILYVVMVLVVSGSINKLFNKIMLHKG